jgi:ABC-type enterochelin transport system permease subunit
MSISSHLGIVILVIVGAVTVLGVIIAAIIETRRMDREKPSMPQQTSVTSADKKKS